MLYQYTKKKKSIYSAINGEMNFHQCSLLFTKHPEMVQLFQVERHNAYTKKLTLMGAKLNQLSLWLLWNGARLPITAISPGLDWSLQYKTSDGARL